jgi:hypothetical protein
MKGNLPSHDEEDVPDLRNEVEEFATEIEEALKLLVE